MFANCSAGGMDMAMPDVCKTPIPAPPGFVPIPYPNMAMLPLALPPTTCLKTFINFMPVHNLGTMIPMSSGDEPGALGGVVSNIFIGPARNTMGSVKTFYGGLPATRSIDPTMQNLINAMGMTSVPSQFKVMILS